MENRKDKKVIKREYRCRSVEGRFDGELLPGNRIGYPNQQDYRWTLCPRCNTGRWMKSSLYDRSDHARNSLCRSCTISKVKTNHTDNNITAEEFAGQILDGYADMKASNVKLKEENAQLWAELEEKEKLIETLRLANKGNEGNFGEKITKVMNIE